MNNPRTEVWRTDSMDILDQLVEITRRAVDLRLPDYDPRVPAHDEAVARVVDLLLEKCPDIHVLAALEERLVGQEADVPLATHLAVKLARSKAFARSVAQPMHVSIVFAVYKERTRMQRPDQHPHGEDCIARKVEQLRWLFDDVEPITWSVYIVDDGCPEGSGHMAEDILAERCPDAPVEVMFLQDAIDRGESIIEPMTSTAESQKGGSVVYGMWSAAHSVAALPEQPDEHVIVYTDADLSTHLGQTGLLVEGIVGGGNDAAIGSRREPTSVVIKKGHRNTRGKLFIYLWKGLMLPLQEITDTQCGFKAFSAAALRGILTGLLEKKFAFDIELLLKTELHRKGSICRVPIAWIDSEEASTTTDLEPYLPMLQAMVTMYRKYLPPEPECERLADLIENMSDAEWTRLADHVPAEIADGEPQDFGSFRPLSVDDLIALTESRPTRRYRI